MPSRNRRGLRIPAASTSTGLRSPAADRDASDADAARVDEEASETGPELIEPGAVSVEVAGPAADAEDEAEGAADAPEAAQRRRRRQRSLPRISVNPTVVVAGLLVILIGVGSWLFLTRPTGNSPIELTAFDEILSAARSGIVDVTSFDYLTLDQDIAEIDAVTTGQLHDDTVAELTSRRDDLVTNQQVSSTEVIAASVTEASATRATVLVVLRARVKNLITPQETVTRYRVEVAVELVDGRWLLSGLTGG